MEQNPGRRPEKHATQKKRPSFPTVRLLCPKSPDLFEQSSGPAIAASTPFASQPGDRGRERSAGKGSRGIHSAPLAPFSGGASWCFSHPITAMMDMARRYEPHRYGGAASGWHKAGDLIHGMNDALQCSISAFSVRSASRFFSASRTPAALEDRRRSRPSSSRGCPMPAYGAAARALCSYSCGGVAWLLMASRSGCACCGCLELRAGRSPR
jgi:hypothetical protein